MGKRKREFWESAYKNDKAYLLYYNRLTELAVSMFEWKNLPDTIDPRFLELTLYAKGQAVFFKDDQLGYLALKVAPAGPFNVYHVPTERRAYAVTGYNVTLNESNSVMMYNSYLRQPSMYEMEYYASRLWDLDRTIDINARAQKTPVLLRCDENERLSLINAYKEFTGNEPVICADKSLSRDGITVMQTDAPYVGDKLYDLRSKIWGEALERLGISAVQPKAERIIKAEAQMSMGGTIACRYPRLKMRQMACDQINAMFGLNVSVEYSQDYQLMDETEIDPEGKGEGEIE